MGDVPYCEEDIYVEFAKNPLFLKAIEALDLDIDFSKRPNTDNYIVQEMLKFHAKEWEE
jgi:hypothetical protein